MREERAGLVGGEFFFQAEDGIRGGERSRGLGDVYKGRIFQVTVPATIIRSAWRGEARKGSIPKRAMSNRDMALAIISQAQQASPKANGHTCPLYTSDAADDPLRADCGGCRTITNTYNLHY